MILVHFLPLFDCSRMTNFNELPFEVFTTAILPYLTAREIGVLCQVNRSWKEFSDDPQVWKQMYLRHTPVKILDTSIHIGSKSERRRNRNKEHDIYRTTGVTSIIHYEGIPFVPEITNRCRDSYWFLHNTWCCDCMPKELKDRLKSWSEIRTDGVDTNIFPRNINMIGYNTTEYCSYVNTEWQKYNHQRGLSTINLCQNPDHYSIDTLGASEDCKKKRSFKKATLKNLEKKPRTELAKATRDKKTKLRRLEKARLAIKQLENQYLEAEENEAHAKQILQIIQDGISLA